MSEVFLEELVDSQGAACCIEGVEGNAVPRCDRDLLAILVEIAEPSQAEEPPDIAVGSERVTTHGADVEYDRRRRQAIRPQHAGTPHAPGPGRP